MAIAAVTRKNQNTTTTTSATSETTTKDITRASLEVFIQLLFFHYSVENLFNFYRRSIV